MVTRAAEGSTEGFESFSPSAFLGHRGTCRESKCLGPANSRCPAPSLLKGSSRPAIAAYRVWLYLQAGKASQIHGEVASRGAIHIHDVIMNAAGLLPLSCPPGS